MKLNSSVDTYIPDGISPSQALARTTHLAIGAHADDLEILAWPGIARCYENPAHWFSGVVITDGAGSPRSGPYAGFSDAKMAATRQQEQRQAAARGKYSALLQLGYTSQNLKSERTSDVTADLLQIFTASQAEVIYLHNLADSHATHVASALAGIEALRQLPAKLQPAALYGVEIWRNLDWLPQAHRVELEVDPTSTLQGELLREFDSQLSGGKRYDLAVAGRQVANATFSQSHRTDRFQASVLAMDLMPLLRDSSLTPGKFLQGIINEFNNAVLGRFCDDDVQ